MRVRVCARARVCVIVVRDQVFQVTHTDGSFAVRLDAETNSNFVLWRTVRVPACWCACVLVCLLASVWGSFACVQRAVRTGVRA